MTIVTRLIYKKCKQVVDGAGITIIWSLMFLVSGISNEIAWRNLTTDSWVTFKVFGLTGISIFFAILSIPVMTKNSIKKDN